MTVAMREVSINGKWPLMLPEHRAAREEWATGWEPARLDSMYANLKPGMTIFDVGTEEGDLSALFAKWVTLEVRRGDEFVEKNGLGQETGRRWKDPDLVIKHPEGGIVLVEPNPRVWPNIRAIFEGNELPAPLGMYVGFGGDRERAGDRDIASGFYQGLWPPCAHGPVIGDHGFMNLLESPQLPVITIDHLALVLSRSVDAVTMDVEGAEILVARGMHRVLREDRPLVWCSVHAEAMFHDHGVYQVEFFSEFHSAGYEKAFLDFDHEAHWFFYPSERREEVVLP